MTTHGKTKNTAVFMPSLSFYFVGLLIVSFFFLALDFIYRNVMVLKGLTPLVIAVNISNAVVFACLVSLVMTPVLWCLEFIVSYLGARLADAIPTADEAGKTGEENRESGKPVPTRYTAVFSIFVMFMLLVYVNGLYLKYFVMSKANITVTMAHTHLQTPIFIFLGVAVAAFLVNQKYTFNYASLEKVFRKVFKPLAILGAVCLVVSLGFFTVNALIPRKTVVSGVSLTPEQKKRPNIIFVTFDSMNAKHMSLYGYERDTTPNLKKLANEFYVFERFRCNINCTGAGLMSFFGRYPRPPINSDLSLMKVLAQNGYVSRSFATPRYYDNELYRDATSCTNILAFEKTGISRLLYVGANRKNFVWLTNILSENIRFFNLFYLIDLRSRNVLFGDPYPLPVYLDYVVDRLKNEPQPAFVWVHTFGAHFPYLVPDDFNEYIGNVAGTYEWAVTTRTVNHMFLTDRYDTNVRYVDREIGRFIEKLKKEGLYDNSIIILSADHGQSIGDVADGTLNKTIFWHGYSTFNDEVSHVPLLIHVPGLTDGKRVQTFTEQVDVAPTLCELLGIQKPDWMDGESLVPYMNNPDRMSSKLKITIPQPLLYRDSKNPMYHSWGPEDTIEVFWDRYKIGWRQTYAPPRGGSGRCKLDKFSYLFVYDILKDPRQTDNLLGKPEVRDLLERVDNHPLVKYFRSADVK